MKSNRTLASLMIMMGLFLVTQLNAASSSVSATLIVGSNNGSQVHPSLKAYERNLKSIFKYSSYDLKGRGNTSVNLPGQSSLSIGDGHTLALNAERTGNGKIKLKVNWKHSGRSLVNTTVSVPPGQPMILGGPSANGSGKLILLIVAR